MKPRLVLIVLVLIIFTSVSYSSDTSVNCEFVSVGLCTGGADFLYANNYFNDASGEVLSSNVATYNYNSDYSRELCCSSPNGNIDSSFVNINDACSGDGIDLLYFTSDYNARVGFVDQRYDIDSAVEYYDDSYYTKKLCVNVPDEYSRFHMKLSNRDFSKNGYTCMFKVSDYKNGVVSSCDAEFNVNNQYAYTVWGRMFESLGSLECNSDCTSKLDNRVYVDCAVKVAGCEDVPNECNGALLESWIDRGSDEVQCSPPWNNSRSKVFTNLRLEVVSDDNSCSNMIAKEYNVILDNEQVKMKVFVCENSY